MTGMLVVVAECPTRRSARKAQSRFSAWVSSQGRQPPMGVTRLDEEQQWRFGDPNFAVDAINVRYSTGPWSGHRTFAYDLVVSARPRCIVELGVHWGVSFFAFAQAIADARLDTRLVGIDTWLGDDHAGDYSAEGNLIANSVRDLSASLYSSVSVELVRKPFNDAAVLQADASIDILHIDGYHTYKATEEDYSTWLPKLAPNGLILVHDTSSNTEYGSARFVAELRTAVPNVHFDHSHGLTVLAPKGTKHLERLSTLGVDVALFHYPFRDRVVLLERQLTVAEETLEARWQHLQDTEAFYVGALSEKSAVFEHERRARVLAEAHGEAAIFRYEVESRQLRALEGEIQRLTSEIQRLRARKSIRLALSLSAILRPIFRVLRRGRS